LRRSRAAPTHTRSLDRRLRPPSRTRALAEKRGRARAVLSSDLSAQGRLRPTRLLGHWRSAKPTRSARLRARGRKALFVGHGNSKKRGAQSLARGATRALRHTAPSAAVGGTRSAAASRQKPRGR
jgi:hypothetical protein